MQIGRIKGNSSAGHLTVVKTWMKTNETGNTLCIFKAFDMEKFFDKEGLIDTLHTVKKNQCQTIECGLNSTTKQKYQY